MTTTEDITTTAIVECPKCADMQHEVEHFQHMEKAADDARGILAVGIVRILQQIDDRRRVADAVASDPAVFEGTPEAAIALVTVEEIERSLRRIHANATRAWKRGMRADA